MIQFSADGAIGLALVLGIGLAIFAGSVIHTTIRRLIHPPRRTYATAVSRGRPGDPSELPAPREFRSWTFTGSGGEELPVWEIAGDASGPDDGPTIILTHGWGDSRIGGLSRVDALARVASRLILWDMPGHGEAPGTCRLGTHEATDLMRLIDRACRPGERVVLMGWSLGAGVSIAAAAGIEEIRRLRAASSAERLREMEIEEYGSGVTLAGVIAESPYRLAPTPARNMMRERRLPFRWNVPAAMWCLGFEFGVGTRWLGFDRAGLAARLPCPLLVIHGEEDSISPVEDGRAIASAASRGEFIAIPGAGHHGIWTEASSSAAAEAVRRFASSLRGGAA